jgi:hypothetical protein
MKKKIIIVAASLLTVGLISGLAILLVGFDVFPHDQFDKRLRAAIDTHRGGVVKISDISHFSWDRMYVFPPYSQAVGVNGEKIYVDEGCCVLLFKEKGKTIYHLTFNRRFGDFSGEHREEGYTPEEALFSVEDGGHKYWPHLKWVQKKAA